VDRESAYRTAIARRTVRASWRRSKACQYSRASLMAKPSSSTTLGFRSLTCCATGNMIAPLCSAHSILSSLTAKTCASSRIEERKHALANVLYRERNGIVFNMHYDGDGSIVFKQACALGCKGIVSKRLGSPYRSGRTDHWLKIKNPKAPAVKREAERQAPGTRAER